jgi:hypothetical protein
MSYYVVKVKVNQEDAKGRIKKLTEQYMVHAVSVTDAEAKVVADFEGSNLVCFLFVYELYNLP